MERMIDCILLDMFKEYSNVLEKIYKKYFAMKISGQEKNLIIDIEINKLLKNIKEYL